MLGITLIDMAEILFFSVIIYYFSLWLKNDKRNNLLFYFYLYSLCFFSAFMSNLTIITVFLVYTAPVLLLLFIIFHEQLLQKNFITLTNKPPKNIVSKDWQQELISTLLYAINYKKSIICVIETTDSLRHYLSSPFIFNSKIDQQLLTFLIESPSFDQKKIMWCTSQGILIGINTQLKAPLAHEEINLTTSLEQTVLLMTHKTDTLVLKADAQSQSFEMIVQGGAYKSLTGSQLLLLLKKHLNITQKKGMIHHENNNSKHASNEQNY